MSEEVVGFSERQRSWFLLRDGGRCAFYIPFLGFWRRCRNTRDLQIHHVVARGYAKRHYPTDFPVNGANQGVSLCKSHHCGYLADGDYRFVVHPDVEEARLDFATNKNSYKEMRDKRRILNESGIPYWETRWDFMFQRYIQKHNIQFLRDHPYPDNGTRGVTGRLS